MKHNLAIGKAGELRVASELLLRGHEVFMSSTDSGTDLILSNGTRIQVKTANKSNHMGSKAYTFCFKSWKRKDGRYFPHLLENVDYVILWPCETNDFFIIPTHYVRGKYSIRLVLYNMKGNRSGTGVYQKFMNNWSFNEKR